MAFDCRTLWFAGDKKTCLTMLWREILPAIDILAAQEAYGVEMEVLMWCRDEHPILAALDDDGNLCVWCNNLMCVQCQSLIFGAIESVVRKMGKTLKAPNGQEWGEFFYSVKLEKATLEIPDD